MVFMPVSMVYMEVVIIPMSFETMSFMLIIISWI
jgi:hypothetical protein